MTYSSTFANSSQLHLSDIPFFYISLCLAQHFLPCLSSVSLLSPFMHVFYSRKLDADILREVISISNLNQDSSAIEGTTEMFNNNKKINNVVYTS